MQLFHWSFLLLAVPALHAQDQFAPFSSATPQHVEIGRKLFAGQCAPCHGPNGNGGTGANLAQPKLKRADDDRALFQIIKDGIPGTEMPSAPAMDDREIWYTGAFVRTLGTVAPEKLPGDAARGLAIYRDKGNCAACHMIAGEGGRFGPELTAIGFKRSAAHLRQSIVEPEADFTERFAYLKATHRNGRSLTGIRLSEDTFALQIMDNSGKPHSFWKADLAKVEILKGKSPMPSYRSTLTAEELDHLIAYLVTLRGEE